MTATPLEFGPRRAPIWVARIFGTGACLFGVGMTVVAGMVADQGALMVEFLGCLGLCGAGFGCWMLVNGARMIKLRAVLTPDALHIVAHSGRHLWIQRGLGEATIPWAEIQGFTDMKVMNPASVYGAQTTYVLYTKRGDFTLNDMQWDNLAMMVREVSARSGRFPGEVAPERAAARAEIQAGTRRLFSFQRIFGWMLVIPCAALLLLVILGGLAGGFTGDLARASIYLAIGLGLGAGMIRFYRK